ncbi:hypothetical protein FB004_1386 [Sinorhizobium medicae]|nr:hypothetical protein FB006_16210 [Sinorhizobium medicae]TWA12786.1 hypothetical protein FB004_1386 [Sinorhizobium medicae]TWA22252.1 hypothetical protein FB007_16012 [Sinorhizobium medicae]TWA31102.1 hypothetical protein FB009_13915 [Sinorhizobium medicae]TWA32774.1 hypothetical protein FB005_1596 [Sinorhizobium medicae]
MPGIPAGPEWYSTTRQDMVTFCVGVARSVRLFERQRDLLYRRAAGLALASYHVYRAPLALATINYDRPL